MLRATLPAPPRCKLSCVTSTTGTGASGEIRATRPQTNSSSITSPTTSTRRSRMAPSRARARRRSRGAACTQRRPQPRPREGEGETDASRITNKTSESPRLYSNSPATKTATSTASPRAPGRPASSRPRAGPHAAWRRRARPPTTRERQPRQAALGGELQQVVVQVRRLRLWGLGPAVASGRRPRPCRPQAEDRPFEHHVDARLPHVVAVDAAGVRQRQARSRSGAGRSTSRAATPAATSSSSRGARTIATVARPTRAPIQAPRVCETTSAQAESGRPGPAAGFGRPHAPAAGQGHERRGEGRQTRHEQPRRGEADGRRLAAGPRPRPPAAPGAQPGVARPARRGRGPTARRAAASSNTHQRDARGRHAVAEEAGRPIVQPVEAEEVVLRDHQPREGETPE